MWPSSWECLSPDTCVRCSNVTDDTCLYNKFSCLCNFKEGDELPCMHREIIEQHKSKFICDTVPNPSSVSVPSTSGLSKFNKKVKRRPRRKRKRNYEKCVTVPPNLKELQEERILETRNLLSGQKVDFSDRTFSEQKYLKSSRSNSSSSTDSSTSNSSSSSDSSSNSSSNSTTDSSDTSTSSSYSSGSSKSTRTDSYHSMHMHTIKNTCEKNIKGYTIIGEDDVKDCDNNCNEGSESTESSNSESLHSDGSTSVSSDNSWWQRYEQLKNIPFLQKNDVMKDSGYVSTTSPNTESTKTDD